MDELGDESSGDDEEEETSVRPYMALLQGFTDNSAPKSKRRKLDHQSSTAVAPNHDLSQSKEEDTPLADGDVDEADEAGDQEDVAEEALGDGSSDEEEDPSDPYDTHFANPDENASAKAVAAVKRNEWSTTRSLLRPWRATYMNPSDDKAEIPTRPANLDGLKLKQKLKETAPKKLSNFSEMEKSFASLLFEYRDILHCDRTVKDSQALRQLVCLHAMNHVFK